MNDDAVRVGRIEFRAAAPSLLLLETLRLAFSVQCLVPASLGFLVLLGANRLLYETPDVDEGLASSVVRAVLPLPFARIQADAHVVVVSGFPGGFMPAVRLLLNALLMGFTGVAVSRAAGLRFCADRRSGALRSMRYALSSVRSIIVSTLLAGLLCVVALGVFWLLLKITMIASGDQQPQTLAGGPAWLGALFLIMTASVCSGGWLLSLAAMGVDSCDGAESLSRGISYVLSRFRRSVCYAVTVFLMTWFLAETVWFLVTQAGILTAQTLQNSTDVVVPQSLGFLQFRWFVVEAWKLSVVYSGATLCYVLLRQVEDGVELRKMDG